ncbi:MAG TPA: hypothetical protein VME45_16315 [Stellaceae bacterium]|nr:hypothetical protein [Stellaceae bacterium]
MVGAIYGAPDGDPAMSSGESNYSLGWVELWVMLFGGLLWLALGGMLIAAARSGRMPAWAQSWTMILHIAAAITVWAVLQVDVNEDGGISIIVPALLPLVLGGYAAAMRLPVFAHLPPGRVSYTALIAGGIVIGAAIPLGLLDKHNLPAHVAADAARLDARIAKEQVESDKARAEEEAHFKTLTPASPLRDYDRYIHFTEPGSPERAAALAGARLVKSRQADAVQMLDDGQITQLWELWQLDLQLTPAFCAAYDRALQKVATSDDVYDLHVGELIKDQLPNIKFFVDGHCNLDASLTAAETRVNKIIPEYTGDDQKEWTGFLATLNALHHKE